MREVYRSNIYKILNSNTFILKLNFFLNCWPLLEPLFAHKHNAKIFALACEILGMEPASVLHAGDHPVEDVIGALDAGLTAVWVNRSAGVWEQRQTPSAEVTSMLGLVELLAR